MEVGASGYSVTGGGDQGIFVKQVLKDSSAAKLFNLREGDQLLSTTIFFDDIKYEDALKILQYSEPYKVQFKIRRKLPAREDEAWASSSAQRGPQGSEKQAKDVGDGSTETPTKTLEGDGDQERLISKPREGRGRRPQKERLSWPKFQTIKSKRTPGPRRSHSSSEAYERGDVPDVSPTSTDTEAQLPAEEQEQKAGPGGQRRRRFLNLKFRMGSGRGLAPVGRPGRGVQGGAVQAGVLEEPTQPGHPRVGAVGEGAALVPGRATMTKEAKVQEEPVPQEGADQGPAPGVSGEGQREGVQGLEIGIARLSLKDTADEDSTRKREPEFQIRIPTLKTPKFGFSKEKGLGTEESKTAPQRGLMEEGAGQTDTEGAREGPESVPEQEKRRAEEDVSGHKGDAKMVEKAGEGKMKMLKFKRPSFGWSPVKHPRTVGGKPTKEREKEIGGSITFVKLDIEIKDTDAIGEDTETHPPEITGEREEKMRMEGEDTLREKDVVVRDSKFRMPKFKMPSFGVSAPSKSVEASLDASLPKVQADVSLPSIQADVKTADLSVELPSAELEVKTAGAGVKLPEGPGPEGEPQEPAAGAGLKGHLPKVQMPSIKVPKVDFKAPQVDIKGPKLDVKGAKGEVTAPGVEVSLPSVEVDAQVPGAKLEGDASLGDKEVAARDSKLKMPKFKMPSFGVSAAGKDLGTSVDVPAPKVGGEATLPSVGAELTAPEGSVPVPSAEVRLPGGELGVALPEGEAAGAELKGKAEGARIKAHLPKVQMPSIKMPKVDIRAPQVDIKGPSADLKGLKGEATAPGVEVSLPSVEVDAQVPGAKLEGDASLGDKEVAARDSKFKMPKFKMPSFGVSAPSKSVEASLDASLPKVQADVSLPSIQADVKTADLSVELPSAELEVKTAGAGVKLPEGPGPEGEPQEPAAGAGLKGHLPKVQMPSIKMPKVDFKAPQVDIKGPKLDVKGAKGEVTAPGVEVSLPSVEVGTPQVPGAKLEGDASLGDKEVAARDSKFKMPKFKMPSFGVSAPSKSVEASLDASLPKVQADVSLPSIQADVKTADLSVELPSAELEVKTAGAGVKLPEGPGPEGEPQEPAAGAGLKGHLPKVQMPSIKMPKVDFKAPQVDIKGPKLDVKGAKGEVTAPGVEVSLPSVEVDAQVPGAKLEGDASLGDKEVAARDSKFKMPKFKMPSFGVSAPSKSVEASLDASLPKVQADVSLPSIQADVKTADLSVELPSAELEVKTAGAGVKLPEGPGPEGEPQEPAAGAGLKGHLPKVQMPSIKMPKVDFKAPQVDIKGPKLDVKGAKGEVTAPGVEVSLPSVEVDAQVPGAKLEGDASLGDKEVAARDSKLKMPKFKMPSFGVSAAGKDLGTSVDVPAPKVGGEATLPSVGAELTAPEGSVPVPSAEVRLPGGELGVALPEGEAAGAELKGKAEGARIKAHLPKVQMPSIKMPKVDIRAPQVDIKGPSADLKGLKGEATAPGVEVSLPSVEVDAQVPGAKLEGDASLGDKEVAAARDSKFKMPKFKMPSFGVSAPSKSVEASLDASLPKVQADVSLPSIQADVKTADLSVELPSAELEVKTAGAGVKLPEGPGPEGEPQEPAAGAGLKGHLPKVQMPSIKMPKVDFKAPQVDIKGPKLDVKGAKGEVTAPGVEVSLPSVEVDAQVPGAKLEGDASLGDKEVAARDSKLKMPKFKMPSFGVSAAGKDLGTSVDVPAPKVGGEATLPSVGAELTAPEGSVPVPSAEVRLPGGELGVALPEGEAAGAELKGKAEGARIKAHLPKVQMPSIKMPQVDIRAPQVDIKGPSADLKGLKGEATAPGVEVSLPSVEVDAQVPGAKLEGDASLGDKEVAARDSKFKMPKFKMPSFGVSAPSKSVEASLDASLPKVQADVSLPSIQADVKTADLSVELPSAELEVKTAGAGVKLPEGPGPEGEPQEPAAGAGLKGHLPKVQMPSIKMPKVDFKAPQVDIKGPKLDVKGAKGEVTAPGVEVSLPSVEVDAQVPGAKLEGDASLGDKEVAARDSKLKMPKFKMPSFGVSAAGKDLGTSVDVPAPKVGGEATLPSVGAELTAPEGSVPVPSAEVRLPGGELGVALPEGEAAGAELKGKAEGARIKAHLPKVQMPSIKMPQVDIRAPQVDIKGPTARTSKASRGRRRPPAWRCLCPAWRWTPRCRAAPGPRESPRSPPPEPDSKGTCPRCRCPASRCPRSTSRPPRWTSRAPNWTSRCRPSACRPQARTWGRPWTCPAPKVGGEATLPSVGAELTAPEGSVPVPSAEVRLPGGELGVALPEGEAAGAELKGKAEGARIKAHLPKVQMPSIKMPKVDIRAPRWTSRAPARTSRPQGGGDGPRRGGVSAQRGGGRPGAGRQAGGRRVPGDKVAARDSKFKMPKFKMPSFGGSFKDTDVTFSSDMFPEVCAGDPSVSGVGFDGSVSVEKCAEKVKSRKSHFKFPKLFSPPERAPGDSLALDTDSAHPLPPSVSVPASEVPGSRSSLQRSRLGWAAFPSAKLELSGPQAEVPTLTECEGVTLTKYQVTVPRAAVPLDVPQEALSGSQVGAHLPSMESSADFPSPERVSLSPTHGHPGPVDPLFPASYGQVTFPIFHRPKFGFSVPKAADAEVEPRGVECAPTLSPLSPTPGLDSSAAEAAVFPLPGTHLPSLEVSVSQGPEGPQDTVETSAMAPGRAPAEEADCEGKSSPLKMPRLKLPSLRWSPKKGAEPKEDPGRSLEDEELSVVVDVGPTGVPPEVPVPGMEAHRDMPPEEDGEEKRAKTPGFGNLKLALPRMKTSKAGADLPQGRPDPSLSSPPGGVGGTSVMVGLPTEAPPQPSCRAPDAEASTAGSPQGDAAAGEVPATSQESWFRMPALHLPSFLRSSKDRGGAGGPGAQMPVPAASTSREGEAPATVKSQGAPVSWSEVEAPTSLQSPEGGADSAAAESAPHTDVLRCSLDSRGLKLDLPADSVSTGMTPLPGPAGPAGAGEGAGERSSHPEGPLRLKASSTDVPSQISVVTMGQLWEDSVQTVRFPKLEVPRFCFPAPSSEADVFVPTVREVQCSESSLDFALSTESPGDWGASILKTGAGVPGEQPVALDLSSEAPPISKVRVHIQGTEVESQEVTIHSRVTAEFAHLLGPEAISTQIVRESDIPASQIRTPSYGFSLLKAKIPEPPTQAGLHMVTRDSRLSEDLREAPRQVTPGADPISGDLQPDTGEPFEIISPGVSVPELQMCAFDVRPGHQFADSCSDEEPAEILEFPPEDSQEAPLADEDGAPKEKPESKRSAGLFRFWLPNIGFSSSVDETSAEPKDDVPKSAPIQTQPEAQPEAGPPKKQEKAGWFRFPKLGFSSTPTKKSKTPKDEAGPAEQNLQEEAVTFFDARETFSPEEKDGEPAEASGAGPGSGAMVASAARTELILLEQDREASEEPAPGPATE
uniref:PDZ domain-containing protein n=1 Tax=Equus asinus TaxID=9793 RepID=A0A9L0I898_EQUAS